MKKSRKKARGLIFKTNWGPEGRKKFFSDRPRPPHYLRVWMTWPPPTEKRQWGAKEGMDELNSKSSKCPRSGYLQDK